MWPVCWFTRKQAISLAGTRSTSKRPKLRTAGAMMAEKGNQSETEMPVAGDSVSKWPFLHKKEWTVPWTCVCMCKTRRRNAINTQEAPACCQCVCRGISPGPMKIQYCDLDRRMRVFYCSVYGIMLCSKRVVEVVG